MFDQEGQRLVIRHLYFHLHKLVVDAWIDGDEDARRAMPARLNEYCDEAAQPYMSVYGTDEARLARATVDFICSLTDRQAILLSSRLKGDGSGSTIQWSSV